MGFTPLEGPMMITRAGDLDPGIIDYLGREMKLGCDEINDILNHKSGICGMTGLTDMKQVLLKARNGDPRCKLAIEMYVYRIVKYIYAYYGVLQGLDMLVFSGGVGENSHEIRQKIIDKLQILDVKAMVIHTEEDREIVRQLYVLEKM